MAPAKVFWDVNILVDFVLQRGFELDETNALYTSAEAGDLSIGTSESVVAIALYLCRSFAQANNILVEFLTVALVLSNETALIKAALTSSFTDKEDAILYHLAVHHRVDAFITRDKKHFARHALLGTPIMTPKEFVRKMSATSNQ